MYYRINIEDGYICGAVEGVSKANGNCTKDQYLQVQTVLLSSPEAPEGFYYRLTENLEWRLCEFKPAIPPEQHEATIEDYQNALKEVGVEI